MQYLPSPFQTLRRPRVVKFSVELLLTRSIHRARASRRRQAFHSEGGGQFERSQSHSVDRAPRGSAAPGSQFVDVAVCGVNSASATQLLPSFCPATAVNPPAFSGACVAEVEKFFAGVVIHSGIGYRQLYRGKGMHMKVERLGCGEPSVFCNRQDQSRSNPYFKRTGLRPAA